MPDGYPKMGGGGVVLEETLVQFENGEGAILSGVTLAIGETYTVNWNGVSYNRMAKPGDLDGVVVTVLGNGSVLGEADTGEPFVMVNLPPEIASSTGIDLAFAVLDGSDFAVVSISGTGGGSGITPMDEKFLPMQSIVDAVLDALSTWNGGSY